MWVETKELATFRNKYSKRRAVAKQTTQTMATDEGVQKAEKRLRQDRDAIFGIDTDLREIATGMVANGSFDATGDAFHGK
eukprot:12438764-Alexandrium_andersonii.AAC.1